MLSLLLLLVALLLALHLPLDTTLASELVLPQLARLQLVVLLLRTTTSNFLSHPTPLALLLQPFATSPRPAQLRHLLSDLLIMPAQVA